MKKHKNKKILLVCAFLFVILIASPFISFNYAAITDSSVVGTFGVADDNALTSILNAVLNTVLGALGTALSAVVLAIIGILYLLLSAVFTPIMGRPGFPGIEQIIFNAVPLFDPNFINPVNEGLSIVGNSSVIQMINKIYKTGYVVGGSVFVIGAMLIGMKLAITSIASEKAYYKEMIVTWLKGLVLLFCVHILVAGVFYINEQIVTAVAESADVDNLQFTVNVEPPGAVGKVITAIINFFKPGDAESATTLSFSATGIGGMVFALSVKALVAGDLISAIAVAALLGQTVSLMIIYFKRTIVCIALGAMAPYMVAVDFIRKLV